jgi:nucleoside-diphosphate-sugar epimerase
MKTLIVGGTGGIGAYVALRMREAGHDVTIAGRNPPAATSCVADFPFIAGDYVEGTFSVDQLKGFDDLVFTAGVDIRAIPPGASEDEEAAIYYRANSVGVPAFFKLAKEAGIRRAAYVGSFYPQAVPHMIGERGYVRSRLDADEGARALADDTFHVVSLNAPWVVGVAPGMDTGLYGGLMMWALGVIGDIPFTVPPGGSNYVSVKSVYESVIGGLERGENGRGYLIGDENIDYRDMFDMCFRAVGRTDVEWQVVDAPHPILQDGSLFAGRAAKVFYEPQGVKELGYSQHDIQRTIDEIAAGVLATVQAASTVS